MRRPKRLSSVKRRPMSRRGSRRSFRRGARTNARNLLRGRPMRGGIRL